MITATLSYPSAIADHLVVKLPKVMTFEFMPRQGEQIDLTVHGLPETPRSLLIFNIISVVYVEALEGQVARITLQLRSSKYPEKD